MHVRIAQASDFEQWLPLWKQYQVFYKTDIPDSVTETTWERFLDEQEPLHCAVAELDGKLVGMVHYTRTEAAGARVTTSTCKTYLRSRPCQERA